MAIDLKNRGTTIIIGTIAAVLVVLGGLYFGGVFSPETKTAPSTVTTSPAPSGAPTQPGAPKQTQ
jgi:hypothetical protein